tara:strand:+ start:467 stop:1318 length:852 start_codon:yes stop_codon:yes gene_type:complete
MKKKFFGSVEAFDTNWKKSPESNNIYWVKKKPINQIQFSFNMLWKLFHNIINNNKITGKKVIEIGCGRGTISSYFADNGYDVTLLDSSDAAIQIAKKIFIKNKHKAYFVNSTLENYKRFETFDIIFSIGLMEHYKKIDKPLIDQIKLLKKGGLFLSYIVPDYKNKNIQKDYIFINNILSNLHSNKSPKKNKKEPVYRNSFNSQSYLKVLKKYLSNIKSFGVYPLPMISHSANFPFTLLDQNSELILIEEFKKILKNSNKKKYFNPWLCEEGHGQAFLIWGIKK